MRTGGMCSRWAEPFVRSLLCWLLSAAAGPAVAAAVPYLTIEAVPQASAASSLDERRWSIYLDGPIDSDAAARLDRLIVQERIAQATVYLNSPGGSLLAAMAIGHVLRAHGFHTEVGTKTADSRPMAGGVCYSACPIAYAGGVWRNLEGGAVLGVHRATNRVPVPDAYAFDEVVSRQLTEYLTEMGVSADLARLMATVPADEIRLLTAEEAVRLRLVNRASAAVE